MDNHSWTFITHHGLVLVYIAGHQKCTAREIAASINVTEWTVHKIINDLERYGYVRKSRDGRVNTYFINSDLYLRHETIRDIPIRDFLKLFGWKNNPDLQEKISEEQKTLSLSFKK